MGGNLPHSAISSVGSPGLFPCEYSSNIHYFVFLFILCAVVLCVLTLVDLEALANSSFGVETEESLFKLLLGPGALAVTLSTRISSGNDACEETKKALCLWVFFTLWPLLVP